MWYKLLWQELFFFFNGISKQCSIFAEVCPVVSVRLQEAAVLQHLLCHSWEPMPLEMLQNPEEVQALPERGTSARAKQNPLMVAPRQGYKGQLSGCNTNTVSCKNVLLVTNDLEEPSKRLHLLAPSLSPISAEQVYHNFRCHLCDFQHTIVIFLDKSPHHTATPCYSSQVFQSSTPKASQ